eukprot:snap_masked-scaffold_14-processed-gene-3.57-mRNA-1 protein AED:1.00 eAED:1.00 QI:0/0/0/0/1/1/4/0/202
MSYLKGIKQLLGSNHPEVQFSPPSWRPKEVQTVYKDSEWDEMVQLLAENTTLLHLDFSDVCLNYAERKDVDLFDSLLSSLENVSDSLIMLQYVIACILMSRLWNCGICDPDLVPLHNFLQTCTALRSLNLGCNAIQSIRVIVDGVVYAKTERGCAITELNLSNNHITDESADWTSLLLTKSAVDTLQYKRLVYNLLALAGIA